jgi:hypothetical protein
MTRLVPVIRRGVLRTHLHDSAADDQLGEHRFESSFRDLHVNSCGYLARKFASARRPQRTPRTKPHQRGFAVRCFPRWEHYERNGFSANLNPESRTGICLLRIARHGNIADHQVGMEVSRHRKCHLAAVCCARVKAGLGKFHREGVGNDLFVVNDQDHRLRIVVARHTASLDDTAAEAVGCIETDAEIGDREAPLAAPQPIFRTTGGSFDLQGISLMR